MLFSLPAVLLSHVCSYVSHKELLATVARTARTSRTLLEPSCFSQHTLELDTFELSVLSSYGPPSLLTLQLFHSRVLSECRLSVQLRPHCGLGLHDVFDSLDYFPKCTTLAAHGHGVERLTDSDLQTFLQAASSPLLCRLHTG